MYVAHFELASDDLWYEAAVLDEKLHELLIKLMQRAKEVTMGPKDREVPLKAPPTIDGVLDEIQSQIFGLGYAVPYPSESEEANAYRHGLLDAWDIVDRWRKEMNTAGLK